LIQDDRSGLKTEPAAREMLKRGVGVQRRGNEDIDLGFTLDNRGPRTKAGPLCSKTTKGGSAVGYSVFYTQICN